MRVLLLMIQVAMMNSPTLTLGGYQASGVKVITQAPPPPPSGWVADEKVTGDKAITIVFLCAAGIGVLACCAFAHWEHTRKVDHATKEKHQKARARSSTCNCSCTARMHAVPQLICAFMR